MSKRSEEAAMKAYPVVIEEHTERDLNKPRRLSYINGYEQAEKDLALTREDIEEILIIDAELWEEIREQKGLIETKEYYGEVLRRFNEYKSKKNESNGAI